MNNLTNSPANDPTQPQGSVVVAAQAKVPRVPESGFVRKEGREGEGYVFEDRMVSFFLDAADLLGVPKSVAVIYGMCFANAQPLSFADLLGRLELSQGSISQGLKLLKEIGALKVVGTHERREYFVPDLELRKLALRYIEERLERQLGGGAKKLRAIKAAVPGGEAAEELQSRIQQLENWHGKTTALMPVMKTFLKLT